VAVEVTIKKWGNSKGAVFPNDFLEKQGIKENDKVLIEVVKKTDFSKLFGSAPKRTMSGQKFKDMVRKGWE